MKLVFELPAAQAEKLLTEAERLGLSPDDLARAALTDLLATPDPEFRAAAGRVSRDELTIWLEQHVRTDVR
jgi:hypothetical protein